MAELLKQQTMLVNLRTTYSDNPGTILGHKNHTMAKGHVLLMDVFTNGSNKRTFKKFQNSGSSNAVITNVQFTHSRNRVMTFGTIVIYNPSKGANTNVTIGT